MKPMSRRHATCIFVLFSFPNQAMAEADVKSETEAKAEIDIDVSAAMGVWSRDFNLPADPYVAAASFKLGLRWAPLDDFTARAEVFGYTTLGNERDRQRAEVRTAVVIHERERYALRVGRQIEVWGRADKLNPTDMLSPRDYRILSSEDDDQRLGLAMVRADLVLSDALRLKGYWVPEFRPTDLIFPLSTQIVRDERHHDTRQFAAKVDSTGGVFDWSLSWYEGRDRIYDFTLNGTTLIQKYNRIRVIGADVAGAAGPWGYRAEAAYTHTLFDPVSNPLVRRPEFWAVIGLDRSFGSSFYANVQASFRQVFKFDSILAAPAAGIRPQVDILRFQQDKTQIGLTANARYAWDDRRWTAEVLGLHYFNRGEGLARFELRHQLTPELSLRARAQKFFGPQNSYFGRVAPASAISVEARVTF
jgi:hypothetical protein